MSQEFKHTNGPWVAKFEHSERSGMSHYEIQYGTDGECIAEIVHKSEDAKLIASAPDMLECLQEAEKELSKLDKDPFIDDALTIIRHGIKKATGI